MTPTRHFKNKNTKKWWLKKEDFLLRFVLDSVSLYVFVVYISIMSIHHLLFQKFINPVDTLWTVFFFNLFTNIYEEMDIVCNTKCRTSSTTNRLSRHSTWSYIYFTCNTFTRKMMFVFVRLKENEWTWRYSRYSRG